METLVLGPNKGSWGTGDALNLTWLGGRLEIGINMLLLKIFTCPSLLFIKKENRQLNMAAFSFFLAMWLLLHDDFFEYLCFLWRPVHYLSSSR
ncbi:hypothetical protein, partial [Paenibacillus mesotrionivorans]